jgi:hypothetical protein
MMKLKKTQFYLFLALVALAFSISAQSAPKTKQTVSTKVVSLLLK